MSYTNQPPTGAAPTFTLTPWGKRVGSALIDSVPAWVLILIGIISGSGALVALMYLLSIAFWVWNMIRQGNTGQTIGKSVLNTKLVLESNAQPVGVGISIGRGLLHFVDGIFCIGYLWPLWDVKRQTFADKILATVVVDI